METFCFRLRTLLDRSMTHRPVNGTEMMHPVLVPSGVCVDFDQNDSGHLLHKEKLQEA